MSLTSNGHGALSKGEKDESSRDELGEHDLIGMVVLKIPLLYMHGYPQKNVRRLDNVSCPNEPGGIYPVRIDHYHFPEYLPEYVSFRINSRGPPTKNVGCSLA
jgi:hypothetical protein